MDKNQLVSEFSRALVSRSAIVFCGAGLSKPAGFPMWEEILQGPRRELGLSNSFSDLTLVAQYYVSNIAGGRERLEAELRQRLDISASPTRAHRLLSKLPLTEIWTTNYDTLLEDAIPRAVVLRTDEDLLLSPGIEPRPTIYKMHGDFSGPHRLKKIVITKDDFETYAVEYPRMWARLTSLFSTQTILFIGISFADPNITHLLSLTRSKFTKGHRRHYTIFKTPDGAEDALVHKFRVNDLESRGISVVEVGEYSEIDDVLSGIMVKSGPPFVFVGGSYEPDAKTDQFCEAVGALLAETKIGVISGGNRPGLKISNSLGENLQARGQYDPGKILYYFQSKETSPPQLQQRLGTVRFQGSDRTAMRELMISEARVALFIGGGDGTKEEMAIAQKAGIPIIPVGGTGGAAEALWASLKCNLASYSIGGQLVSPKDHAALGLIPFPAATISKALIERAIFG